MIIAVQDSFATQSDYTALKVDSVDHRQFLSLSTMSYVFSS